MSEERDELIARHAYQSGYANGKAAAERETGLWREVCESSGKKIVDCEAALADALRREQALIQQVARMRAACDRILAKALHGASYQAKREVTLEQHFKVWATCTVVLQEEDVKALEDKA